MQNCPQCGFSNKNGFEYCQKCNYPASIYERLNIENILDQSVMYHENNEFYKAQDLLKSVIAYSADANFYLGYYYWKKSNDSTKYSQAEVYLKEGIRKGFKDSHNIFGKFYYAWALDEFTKLDEQYELIINLLIKSIQLGYKEAIEPWSVACAYRAIQLRKSDSEMEFSDEVERYIQRAKDCHFEKTNEILGDFYFSEAAKAIMSLDMLMLADYPEKLLYEAAELGKIEVKNEVAEVLCRYLSIELCMYGGSETSKNMLRYLTKISKYGTTKHKELVTMIYQGKAYSALYLDYDVNRYEELMLKIEYKRDENINKIGPILFMKGIEYIENPYSDENRLHGINCLRKAANVYGIKEAADYLRELNI